MSRKRRVFDFTRGQALGVAVTAPAGYAQGADRLLSLVGADTPRFEYDVVTGACLGLLAEPAATNLVIRSRALADAAWSKVRATVVAGYGADGGAASGSLIRATAPAAVVYQPVSGLTPGKRYTFSAYVRGPRAVLSAWSGSGPWVADVSAIGVPRRLSVDGVRLEHRLPGVDTGWPAADLWRYDHAAKTVTIGVNPAGKTIAVDLACLVGCIGFYLGEGTLAAADPVRHRAAGRALSPKSPGVAQLEIAHPDHPFRVGDEVWFSGGTWGPAWAPAEEAGRRQNPTPGNARQFFTVVADKRAETRDGGGAPGAPAGYCVKLPEAFRHPQHLPEADGGANVGWLGGQWWRLPHLQTGDWQRVYVTRRAPASGTLNPAFFIQADYTAAGPYDFSGEMPAAFASEGFLVDFCQLQEGDYPTSPIVTAGAPASRAADQVLLPLGADPVAFSWGGLNPAAGPVSPLALADRRICRRVQLRRGAGSTVEMTVTSSYGDFARMAVPLSQPPGGGETLPDGEYLTIGSDELLTIATDEFLVRA